jgi:WD repeat-containing protein 70
VWDLRSFKKPLSSRSGLGTLYPGTNAIFSPDDKYVISGAAATSKGGKGKLMILNKGDLSEVVRELVVDSTPVKVLWHSKINQVGCQAFQFCLVVYRLMMICQILTGLSNGEINVLYSPLTSLNGAKLLLSKGPPRKRTFEDVSDAQAAPHIVTPHALPMFRDGDGIRPGSKRKREKERMDPRKSKRPELPVTGPGRGGRVGASATQHVVQNLVRDTTRDEDVRTNFVSVFFLRLVFCNVFFFGFDAGCVGPPWLRPVLQ